MVSVTDDAEAQLEMASNKGWEMVKGTAVLGVQERASTTKEFRNKMWLKVIKLTRFNLEFESNCKVEEEESPKYFLSVKNYFQ